MRHIRGLQQSLPPPELVGAEIYEIAAQLYPINRSLTGDGVRQSLHLMQRYAPFAIREVPAGTKVLDWEVPPEWNLRSAYIVGPSGRRVVDLSDHNLHVVGYSTPVDTTLSLQELRPHLHSLPNQPDLIPYRTSYYRHGWGFCLTHRQMNALSPGNYRVVIDSSFDHSGSLTYGELFLPGSLTDEVLLSAHVCHPSLANDNCSGLALLAWLGRYLGTRRTRFSYRIIFAPGTVGAITWLARNREGLHRIRHGLVVSNVGDGGGPTYKRSRRGNAEVDRAAALVMAGAGDSARCLDFSPYGYDERQYCSPGFDLPVGSFQSSRWGEFPEYHTSADNLDFIKPEHLARSLSLLSGILDVLEGNEILLNTSPFGEPQLGRRGLYDDAAGRPLPESIRMAILWVLNLADGRHSLVDMAERSGMAFSDLRVAADRLVEAGLLVVPGQPDATLLSSPATTG